MRKRYIALLLALALTAVPALAHEEEPHHGHELPALEETRAGGAVIYAAPRRRLEPFCLGLARAEHNGRQCVVRQDGKELLSADYDTLTALDCGLYIAEKGDKWGVVSILPYDGPNGPTHEIYPIQYRSVTREVSGGVDALVLIGTDGGRTVMPLFRLPAILTELGVPGGRFPLSSSRTAVFADVSGEDWFSLWVELAYNTGIMRGTGGDCFEPQRVMTVAECLQMAANMDSCHRGDSYHTNSHRTDPWYQGAVDYCHASGITAAGEFDDFARPLTRRELARVFASTALARSLPEINSYSRVASSVGDVAAGDPDSRDIYSLYAKGILTGVDGALSFNPDGLVTRAEAAALAARLARPEQRVELFS